jgi:hypothetical protein
VRAPVSGSSTCARARARVRRPASDSCVCVRALASAHVHIPRGLPFAVRVDAGVGEVPYVKNDVERLLRVGCAGSANQPTAQHGTDARSSHGTHAHQTVERWVAKGGAKRCAALRTLHNQIRDLGAKGNDGAHIAVDHPAPVLRLGRAGVGRRAEAAHSGPHVLTARQ